MLWKSFCSKIQYNFADDIDLDLSEHKDLIKKVLSNNGLPIVKIKETNRVEVYGNEYVASEFVAIEVAKGKKEGMPIFGKIMNIFLTDEKALLLCEEWPSEKLKESLNAYCIKEGNKIRLIDADDLADPKPYTIWPDNVSDGDYICLHYVLL